MARITDVLEISGLGKDYGDVAAVKALDLTVREGEIFGLLGPNGAGKTTTISMVCGVLTPSRGSARVAGHDVLEAPFPARRALGLVPQDLALYDDLTARQNLDFFASTYDLSGARRADRVAWALDLAGLEDRADDRVGHFSGGMKRRLNLATGLLHEPRLVVLDEPTVGVDPQSRKYIFETIRALNRDHATTVIYTSHYMEEVEALCDRVAIMDHGELIALDTVDGLIGPHASGLVELTFDGPADALVAALTEVGVAEDGVAIDGTTARFPPGPRLGAALAAIEARGVTLGSIHTHEADLEAVFLALTGHRMRDH